jgi:hypothetical protein
LSLKTNDQVYDKTPSFCLLLPVNLGFQKESVAQNKAPLTLGRVTAGVAAPGEPQELARKEEGRKS